MYSYLMSASDWNPNRDTMPLSRCYALHDERFKTTNGVVSPALLALPALLMPEVHSGENQTARLAKIHGAKISGHDVVIDYTIDSDIPPLLVSLLIKHANDLAIPTNGFMLQHTHWDVHNADLYLALLRMGLPKPPEATVFKVDHSLREKNFISVMMPFDAGFIPVYEAIKSAADATDYSCNRADDIWLHPHIMQTVVSLICKSGIVIADCSTKNPNVFYEAGIAHTLGRDVILIAQRIEDVPFDLRHISIITYHPNAQGLADLTAKLIARIRAVADQQMWD
jgi:hypothetical protein